LSATAAHEGQALRALEALLLEVEAVKRAGFRPSELAAVRANVRSDLLSDLMEKEQISSDVLSDELIEEFLSDRVVVSLQEDIKISNWLLDDIQDQEVQEVSALLQWRRDCLVHITVPRRGLLHGLTSMFG
jgi:hypothetical protein